MNSGIIRKENTDNYSVVCNECFRDESISARAKGLFAYIMTLPDDWKIYKSELYNHFKEGRDALNVAFAELETSGYIHKHPSRNKDGTVNGWSYTVYESTVLLKNRNTVNPSDGESASTKYLSKPSTNKTNMAFDEDMENNSNPKPPSPPKKQCPPDFEAAWVKYGRKGNKQVALKYWCRLSQKDKDEIARKIPEYISSREEVYRKDFQGWINPANRIWEDKIVAKKSSPSSGGISMYNF